MRNTLLIVRREYLERVRTKSFLISTLVFPLLIAGLMILPAKIVMLKSSVTRHIAVVAADAGIAQAVQTELEKRGSAPAPAANQRESQAPASHGPAYRIEVDLNATDSERANLRGKVSAGELDGFLWLGADLLQARKPVYYGRETSDFVQQGEMERAVRTALIRQSLAARGVTAEEVDALMQPMDLDVVTLKQGKESRSSGVVQFFSAFILVMMLYITLVLYGVAVMRSVLEEKTSRVVEVMLSSATAKQLMAGKLAGVGAVGLTQIFIWVALGALFAAPSLAAARSTFGEVRLPLVIVPAFALFFVLGYLLYSALFAALGAMVNSEQEAQQFQFLITLPIIVPLVLMNLVMRQPNSPAAFWLSLVPFFAPILMYLRIIVSTPPGWQVALSIGLLLGTTYGVLALCSRIYRVGILMYGKKPTLPEILKWTRYA